MPLAYRTDENNPLILALCHDTPICGGLNLDVDERDEMLGFFLDTTERDRDRALAMYFQSGLLLWDSWRTLLTWRFGDLSRIGKLLDFASGYGRVTRFLVSAIPPDRVWISDIYEDAVRFQAETFGVHGLPSAVDPRDFRCDHRFDVILVSSLFTHLPEPAFHGWLRRLFELLAPGGLLAFSVHDPGLVWPPPEMPPSGLRFEEVSESGTLDKSQYGSAWVTEGFVRRAIAAVSPGASAHRVPRGLVNFQDLWVVIDEPGVDFSGLPLRGQPEGYLDHCSFEPPDRIRVSGWTVDRVLRQPVREIRASLGGQTVRCSDFFPRGDVAALYPHEPVEPQGWSLDLQIPPGASRATLVLRIHVVDAAGAESTLYTATLDAALLRSTRLDLLVTRHELAETRGRELRLADVAGQVGWEKMVLESRVAAMEASWFWRLRNRWFAVKRWLRLTDQP